MGVGLGVIVGDGVGEADGVGVTEAVGVAVGVGLGDDDGTVYETWLEKELSTAAEL